MRKVIGSLAMFGAICLGLGLYLFPFGADAVYKFFIDNMAGGEYWLGILYVYILCFILIAIGLAFYDHSILTRIFTNPMLCVLAILLIIFLAMIYMESVGSVIP